MGKQDNLQDQGGIRKSGAGLPLNLHRHGGVSEWQSRVQLILLINYVKLHGGDGCQIPLISITATLALFTCHPSVCLIYKVVMAIHSNVISCHINTYISGRYYKGCNGGASGLHWESVWGYLAGCYWLDRQKTHISINPAGKKWKSVELFYYHKAGFCFILSRFHFVQMCFLTLYVKRLFSINEHCFNFM